jgi:hypothetical protein
MTLDKQRLVPYHSTPGLAAEASRVAANQPLITVVDDPALNGVGEPQRIRNARPQQPLSESWFSTRGNKPLIEQLRKNLYTRQAVLPVFFPEDTGNINNVRVPCSLHYHFMFRQGLLHMRYDMRSCDFVRHFRDDVYLAARLLQWMGQQIEQPHGKLYVTIGSLHAMEGDRWKLEQERKNGY